MKDILIISHANANSGAIDRLEDFLLRQGNELTKITHPLDTYKQRHSFLWIDGVKIKSYPRHELGLLSLLMDIVITLQMSFKLNSQIVVGANNFDTCTALLRKKLLRKHGAKIIYFASDYSVDRFTSQLKNKLYKEMEKVALARSDLVVSNTYRAESKRLELGLDSAKSIVVYNTAYLRDPVFKEKPLTKTKFIYVGSITLEHGLYNFLLACGDVIRSLTIVGDGPDRKRVLKICSSKGIKVSYLGQKDHDSTINIMRKFSGFGIAPYSFDNSKYTYYGSSLKIYEYLACGLPVVTSNVTEQSDLVEKYGLGIVYNKLDHQLISQRLRSYELRGFNKKASSFYDIFNQDTQYKKIML